jgi:high-affinity iron transporter
MEQRQPRSGGVCAAALVVIAMIIWQGVTAHGAPDPTRLNTSPTAAFLDIGVLVFREGLECILVLAAITASMTGSKQPYRRPVALGTGIAFVATLITWFIAVRIVGQLSESIPALHLQAATGLLAVIVLLVIMNWFFHKIYWGGWIRAHNRRRKVLLANSAAKIRRARLQWGLILLGFTSLYREGFEVVLFLQSYNLRLGGDVVLKGAVLGIPLSGMVAILTFFLQQRLQYRKMLITTGILLGIVLLVMVGEQAQEMQLAHWIPTTQIGWLANYIPAWVSMWFAVFPTYGTMVAQLLAAILVVGSYYVARPTRTIATSDSTELVGMQRSPSNSTNATAAAFSFSQSLAATDLVAIREHERARIHRVTYPATEAIFYDVRPGPARVRDQVPDDAARLHPVRARVENA